MCSSDIFLGLIAILFPPLAVWVKRGLCSADSLINILLCMLGFLPGLLHAWYIIAKFPDEDYNYDRIPDAEGARVAYVVVQGPSGRSQRAPKNAILEHHYQQQGYGTTAPMEAPTVQQQQNGTWTTAGEGQAQGGEGSSAAVPPSYAEAVKGDHKVQSRD
ncbi:dba9bff5-2b69-4e90-aa3e-c6b78e02980c [Sclerotinia trifoliorum]|uniref:Dba9bff5-2b69-4e90-aa3e-c6b78e02980c n=1 Tax=Sclerotinia trifoliorum TaxID=28548 RepID=A0A8H2W0Z9_9HELO|nr:dba9bff5-2b69-4e90-aa3e-c6b78e02980c [Sclerotinia trifoliorum]